MSTLPDRRIHDLVTHDVIGIDPYSQDNLQPASYDLTLDNVILTYKYEELHPQTEPGEIHLTRRVDVARDESDRMERTEVENLSGLPLPNPFCMFGISGFALASTVERVRLPPRVIGRVEGKSSLARLGLFVHVTAGFIDPGFEGHITLELYCANGLGLVLYPGMKIAQIAFDEMDSAAAHPYGAATGAKYQNQPRGPQPSQYWKNFTK